MAKLQTNCAWAFAAMMGTALVGCGKTGEPAPQPYAMPEVNAINCKFEAITAIRQRMCPATQAGS